MYLTKILFFGLLVSHSLTIPVQQQYDGCGEVAASVVISEESEGTKVTVTPVGGQAPYKYIFYKQTGHLISEGFDSNAVTGLAKGKYFCTVIDKNNCKKTIDIEIK